MENDIWRQQLSFDTVLFKIMLYQYDSAYMISSIIVLGL